MIISLFFLSFFFIIIGNTFADFIRISETDKVTVYLDNTTTCYDKNNLIIRWWEKIVFKIPTEAFPDGVIVSEINYVEFDRRPSVLTKIYKTTHCDSSRREIQANRIARSYWDPTGLILEREVSWAFIADVALWRCSK